MENSIVDLEKLEEETKEKISAVNVQKVSIVRSLKDLMEVWQ